ncbi:hypothetical protein BC940DRAFT_304306 [Gongronella butleri]|nr:hypothetical protein BC940DRAFT_304306 [Gongronella butleri]
MAAPDDNKTGLIVGLTVGLVAGLGLLAALGFWLFRRRQRAANGPGSGDDDREKTTMTSIDSVPPTPPPKDPVPAMLPAPLLHQIPEEATTTIQRQDQVTTKYFESALHIPPLMDKTPSSIQRSLTLSGNRPSTATATSTRMGTQGARLASYTPQLQRSASVKVSKYDNLNLDQYDDDLDHVRIRRAVSINRARAMARPLTPPPAQNANSEASMAANTVSAPTKALQSPSSASSSSISTAGSGSSSSSSSPVEDATRAVMYARPTVARVRSLSKKDHTHRVSIEPLHHDVSASSSPAPSARNSTAQEGEITVIMDPASSSTFSSPPPA